MCLHTKYLKGVLVMRYCKLCNEVIPYKVIVDGKDICCSKRLYCIKCNPIGVRAIWRGKKTTPKTIKGKRTLVKTKFTCNSCGIEYNHKTRNKICSKCRSKKIRNEHKKQAVIYLGGKCGLCNYNKCISVLSFHHKDPTTKAFTLSWNWSKPWEILKKELDKCQLVCANCHGEIEAGLIST